MASDEVAEERGAYCYPPHDKSQATNTEHVIGQLSEGSLRLTAGRPCKIAFSHTHSKATLRILMVRSRWCHRCCKILHKIALVKSPCAVQLRGLVPKEISHTEILPEDLL